LVDGSLESPYENFLFAITELFSLALTVEALQGERVKTHCDQERVGDLEPRFQGEGVVPGEYFVGFLQN